MKMKGVNKQTRLWALVFFYDYICMMILNQQGSESNRSGNSAQATQVDGAERHGTVAS